MSPPPQSTLHLVFYCVYDKSVNFFIIPAFFEEKKGIMCYRSPSVRPSGNSLPASPPTLLMLESPNLYA